MRISFGDTMPGRAARPEAAVGRTGPRPGATPLRDSVLKPALVCALVAVMVCTLGTCRLDTHSMEGIIALGGEHMVASGEWFVPKLYGTVYAYKPALAYWLAGLSLHTFGRHEFALRLPTAACAIAMCLLTFWMMARLATPRCGLYAALSMCFCALYVRINAEYNDGLLEITAPVAAAAAPRQVEIKGLPKAKAA